MPRTTPADGSTPLPTAPCTADTRTQADDTTTARRRTIAGDWYTLGEFGKLKLTIGYYIDTLTVVMFCMVTLIASCIHIYAYRLHARRAARRTPTTRSRSPTASTCTAAAGSTASSSTCRCSASACWASCIAGNLAMVFVFWELVGICSYFLIGFYIERHSASTAANKAFIVNRVGDFGMLIGLMALWTTLGTFNFGDMKDADGTIAARHLQPASHAGEQLQAGADRRHDRVRSPRRDRRRSSATAADRSGRNRSGDRRRGRSPAGRHDAQWGHWLLFIAGVGIFCGCVGKSASSRCTSWLPDAMEGPTPVSRAGPLGDDGRRRRVSGRAGSIRCSRPKCCW